MSWINNKVPLHDTGNYNQYPVINHYEQNIRKYVCVCIYIHIYIGLILLYRRNQYNIVNQLCFNQTNK